MMLSLLDCRELVHNFVIIDKKLNLLFAILLLHLRKTENGSKQVADTLINCEIIFFILITQITRSAV